MLEGTNALRSIRSKWFFVCAVVGFLTQSVIAESNENQEKRTGTSDYRFSDGSQLKFQLEEGKPDIIFYSPANGNEWKEIYRGEERLFGIPYSGETTGVPAKYAKRRSSLSFMFVEREGLPTLFLTPKGKTYTSELFPSEWQNVHAAYFTNEGRDFVTLSFQGENPSTIVCDIDRQTSAKLSASALTPEELAKLKVTDSGYIYLEGLRRVLDLKHLDLEGFFNTRAVPRKKDDGIITSVEQMLEDFRTSSASLTPIQPTEEDSKIIRQIADAFRKETQKSVILLGQSGTGKTTLIQGILKYLPRTWRVLNVPREVLEAGGRARGETEQKINLLIQAAKQVPIIYIMDEMHSLKGLATHSESSVDMLQMMKKPIAAGELMIIGTDTPEEYRRAYEGDPALMRRFNEIRIPEPTKEDLPVKLSRWMAANKMRPVSPELLRRIIRISKDFDPGASEPARSVRLLEQLKTQLREAKTQTITKEMIDEAAVKVYGVGPEEPRDFLKRNEEYRALLREKVVDQAHVTDAMCDLWRDIHLGTGSKRHRSILLVGPTGAGKTFSGQSFAKYVLQDAERFIEIDATKYKNGGHTFDSLIGTASYSSSSPRGILPEFLSGRGKGRNVIVINEIEKAHPDLIKILMEMLDTGKLQAGNGKTYYLGRSLIVFTSNKSADQIYPRGYGKALSRKELEKRLASFNDKAIRELFLKPSSKNLYDTSEVWGVAELQRIDRALPIAPPSMEGAIQIATQSFESLNHALKEEADYEIQFGPDSIEKIVESVYVPEDGVRAVQKKVDEIFNRAQQTAVVSLDAKPGDTLVAKIVAQDPKLGGGAALDLSHANAPDRKATVENALQKSPNVNPLSDPSEMAKLMGLESRLQTRVFGQQEAIRSSARAARARALNPKIPSPAFQVYLGPTGIGKSELAKALAVELFGDKKRAVAFEMGKVKTEADFTEIFGSKRGYVGSDTYSPFEQMLNDFPEGAVIVFDEVGNMGADKRNPGASPYAASREELLKRFYSMIAEGTWMSPLGKTYSLKNHYIVFTSNEGEETFQQLPTDDLRIAEWKRLNKKEILHAMLRERGWPEALLGRIGNNITMFKPLVADEQEAVSRKEIGRALQEIQDEHGLPPIEVSEDFHRKVARSFFSHAKGARSIGEVANAALTDLVGLPIFEFSSDLSVLKNARMSLDIEDNHSGHFKIKRGATEADYQRKVSLILKVTLEDGTEIPYSYDVSGEVPENRVVSTKTARGIAYHEAGHVVANDPELTGDMIDFVTIKGAGMFGGYARYRPYKQGGSSITRDAVLMHIARLLAGGIAQEFAGFERDAGWQSDIERARKIAQEAVTTWGLVDGALELPVKNGQVIVEHPKTEEQIAKLMKEGEAKAREVLQRKWVHVRLLSIELMRKGYLNAEEIQNVLAKASSMFPDKIGELQPGKLSMRWKCMETLLEVEKAKQMKH